MWVGSGERGGGRGDSHLVVALRIQLSVSRGYPGEQLVGVQVLLVLHASTWGLTVKRLMTDEAALCELNVGHLGHEIHRARGRLGLRVAHANAWGLPIKLVAM